MSIIHFTEKKLRKIGIWIRIQYSRKRIRIRIHIKMKRTRNTVLDHSESIDMNIEKLFRKKNIYFLISVRKIRFICVRAGGGSKSYGNVRNY